MRLRILAFLFVLGGCTSQTAFEKKFQSLKELKIPVSFTSRIFYQVPEDSLSSATIHGYDIGHLPKIDPYFPVVSLVPSSIFIPSLYIYDKKGNIIDFIVFFKSPGGNPGFRSFETMSIDKDGLMTFTDSTETWDLDTLSDGYHEIEGTRKLEVTTEKFSVNDQGKIVKIK